MTIFQAIIIAIIEGLTEFLPISSTAHMRFANPFLGIQPSPFVDMFEVVIQFAAILSVVVIFYKKFFDFKRTTFYLKLIIAVIPALIVGAILKDYIDTALDNLIFISCVMIGGGILLLFIDKLFKRNIIHDEKEISLPKAFAIGCFQCLAILLPGLSRSAATIVGGMQQKLTRTLAAEFSFFLAVPTMFAASVKSFWDVYKDHPDTLVSSNISVLAIGAVVSFIVALIAVKSFIGYLQKHGFRAFGVYRIILGIVILVLALKGML
ncbi:undecaprenyl-diphosphate phosphatase [Parafilimonas sp.]|uniref:undecaprenyl-diphosphate phosphatase n=1 Tax=Parafilimonas sp. TaxID=1969739 RepID=UPI003F81EA9D